MTGEPPVDLLVIGGGIDGTTVARDAAGRGLSVMLCEQNDLGSGVSWAIGEMIGGPDCGSLRQGTLKEGQALRRAAPHLISPLRVIRAQPGIPRPVWLGRLEQWRSSLLPGRLEPSRLKRLTLSRDLPGAPLKPEFGHAVSHSGCWLDDSRLVVLNALDAAERGAEILTRTRCSAARRSTGLWYATLHPAGGGRTRVVRARALVNAAGPWVAMVLDQILGVSGADRIRLAKSGHVVVPRLFEGDYALILPEADGYAVFVVPYERHYSLIGATGMSFEGDPAEVAVEDAEIEALCAAVNRCLEPSVTPDQVLWTFAALHPQPVQEGGVRRADQSGAAVALDLEEGGEAPLLSIIGGSFLCARLRAEQAIEQLRGTLNGAAGSWTLDQPLPGGDMPDADFERFLQDLLTRRNWLPSMLARRYARAYGTRVDSLLGEAERIADLGEHLGEGLYEIEVDYLVRHEFAETAEDILWRRSKLGLHVSESTTARLEAWLRHHTHAIAAAALAAQA